MAYFNFEGTVALESDRTLHLADNAVNGKNNELIDMTLQNSGWTTVGDEFGSIDNALIDGLTALSPLVAALALFGVLPHCL